MVGVMESMVDKSRGKSLADLGYNDVGLDDNYQQCGAGANGSFHIWDPKQEAFVNMIRQDTFPDMKAFIYPTFIFGGSISLCLHHWI